jgi:hypothetical protein
MTPPKRWPTDAEWAREDGVSGCRKIQELVDAIMDELYELTQTELLRRLSVIRRKAQEMERSLLAVGPGR